MQHNKIGIQADSSTEVPFISDDDMGDVGAMPAPGLQTFRLSLLTATKPKRLAKRIELNPDGTPKKIAGGDLIEGHAQVVEFAGLQAFAAFLESLKPNQALTYGLPAQGDGDIVPRKARKSPPPGKQFRTKEGFIWPDGAGVFMVDYDAHGDEHLNRDELFRRIVQALPALAEVQVLWRPSGSSCIYRDDGSEVYGINGQRLYFLVDDAKRIPEIGKALIVRLWLNGHGYIEVSKSGAALTRTTADSLVWQTNRLDFAGGAELGEGLQQKRGACILMGGTAACLHSQDVPLLSAQELADYSSLVAKAKREAAPEIAAVKAAYVSSEAPVQAARRGIDEKQAEALVRAVINGAPLDGGWIIHLETGEEVTVRDVLKEPEKYNGMYCRDPLTGRPDQPQVAWLKLLKRKPEIFNHKTDTWYPLQTARTILHIVDGNAKSLADDVCRAMRNSGDFYRQGERVCTVNAAGQVRELKGEALLHEIEGICEFQAYRKEGKQFVGVVKDCPEKIGQRITSLAWAGNLQLPELRAVAKNPIITHSGVIIEDEGYHAETGVLLLNPSDTPWEPVPRKPTTVQVVDAFNKLWEPFHLFPYADINARSATLAAILTAVIRSSLDVAPAFMFSAPTAGTGKSFLAEAIGELTGGFTLAKPPAAKDEFDKVITSLLLKGDNCYLLDNADSSFGTGSFDALLTSGKSSNRVLGKSETVEAHRALWLITGNNSTVRGDTNRRVLSCYLDAQVERVLDRSFSFDPREMVRSRRHGMVRAALTIIQAWLVSPEYRARPNSSGDFNQWRRMVAACVGWLGEVLKDAQGPEAEERAPAFADPAPMLQAQMLERDDNRHYWADALEAWADMATEGYTAMTSKELWALIADDLSNAQPRGPRETLAAAIGACFDKLRSSRQLGQLLSQKLNVRANGLMLVRCGQTAGGGGKAATRYDVVSTLKTDDSGRAV